MSYDRIMKDNGGNVTVVSGQLAESQVNDANGSIGTS